MSKPHLAIQNQAVKYAQKDMNGNDIVQYDYVAVDLTLSINYNNISYKLYIKGLYIDIKDNYKKLPNSEDITLTDIMDWISPLVIDQNGTVYLSGGDMNYLPVTLFYDNIGKKLTVSYLDASDILPYIDLANIEPYAGFIRINPLTEYVVIYEL